MFAPFENEPAADLSDPEISAAFQAALKDVGGQLGADYPMIIGGEPIETGEWLTSVNPARTEEVIGRSAKAGTEEIEQAVDAAWEAFAGWSEVPIPERAALLVELAAVIRRRKHELGAWNAYESAKNFAEALGEVEEAIDFCEYYARQALPLAEPVETVTRPGEDNVTFYKPLGVGISISPWNFPLAILAGMAVGPAVAGNTVILKPSPYTPINAHKFMECVEEAGYPPGVFNLLTGEDADIGDALVDHPQIRFINFTGSLATGSRINERAAKVHPGQGWIKAVHMELGGKDALIVDETADPDYAADVAIASGFGYQGQKCSAMSRLIIVDEAYDEVLERFVTKASALSLGPPEENPDMSALINQQAQDKSMRYIEDGTASSRLVIGGTKGPAGGYFVNPTVFADVPRHAAIAKEEIFGPVVAVMRATDFDDALDIANDTEFGLTGGVVSNDPDRLEKARREFEVGNLYLNRKITGALVGMQPFGGLKLSGNNLKAGGPDYVKAFMEMKTVAEKQL